MKAIYLILPLLALGACVSCTSRQKEDAASEQAAASRDNDADEYEYKNQHLGRTLFVEDSEPRYEFGTSTKIVHKTSSCRVIYNGIVPQDMSFFTGWYQRTMATGGKEQADSLESEIRYCPKCLSDGDMVHLYKAFHE